MGDLPSGFGKLQSGPDDEPLEGAPPAWAYGGAPIPADAFNTTVVHHDAIKESITWLEKCQERVNRLINEIQDIPKLLGNPVMNNDADIDTSPGGTLTPTQRKVEGQLGAPGPTKFGLTPNGKALAVAHINTYNAALASLHDMSDQLGKALSGTKYIAQQYKAVEDANAADIARIMSNPPYQPGADAGAY
jgi:hypothetical protein